MLHDVNQTTISWVSARSYKGSLDVGGFPGALLDKSDTERALLSRSDSQAIRTPCGTHVFIMLFSVCIARTGAICLSRSRSISDLPTRASRCTSRGCYRATNYHLSSFSAVHDCRLANDSPPHDNVIQSATRAARPLTNIEAIKSLNS